MMIFQEGIMAVFKCKMCGASLEINNESVATCEYCGTQQTLPKLVDDKRANMYDRANHFRRNNEFDKAMVIYEQILNEDSTDAETYWSLVLCRYGIEYVEDPTTHKRLPTVNRAQFTSIFDDDNYKSALKNADSKQKTIYEEEAKVINEIQKGILAISSQEEPFDVFICYKESDNSGRRTPDSVLANDLYHQLVQEGFKVFFARITLEDKLGSAYEPYIFAALNSAKVMVVLGTKPEYFNAVWVKNEWSRYLGLIKQGQKKMLIPAYKDMDPYDLPEEFSHLQAQDMSKLGFMQDLIRGIKKIAQVDEPQTTVVKETVVTSGNANTTAPLLERAFMFLEDGEFAKADDFCEQVLNLEPKNAQAYVGKLMAELRVKRQTLLKDCSTPFDSNNNYQKAIRFADAVLKNELTGYNDYIRNRIQVEIQRKEEFQQKKIEMEMLRKYKDAVGKMQSAENSKDFDKADALYCEAADIFDSIIEFRDSAELSEECVKKAKEAGIGSQYNEAIYWMEEKDYWQAAELFEEISDYKDSKEKADFCRLKGQENDVAERRAAKVKRRKKRLIKFLIFIAIVLVILYFAVGKAFFAYQDAISLLENGNYVEAYEALIEMDGYKDSTEKAASIYEKYKTEKLKSIKVGDYIYFGIYEQDNDTDNGKEQLEWVVLDVKDGKVLVTSKYLLEAKCYDKDDHYATWENSDIRQWLNNEFMNIAFSTSEKEMIAAVMLKNEPMPGDNKKTEQGNDTIDKVFLLSYAETQEYFASNDERKTEGSEYLLNSGDGYEYDPYGIFGSTSYWLTRTKTEGWYVSVVSESGKYGRYNTKEDVPVRPAMWIDISEIQ